MFELILLLVLGGVIFFGAVGFLFVASIIMGAINLMTRMALGLLRVACLLIALPFRLLWGVRKSVQKVRERRAA